MKAARIRGFFAGTLLLIAVAGGVWFYTRAAGQEKATVAASATPPRPAQPPGRIASRGRIEPLDGIIRVSARSISGQPSIVGALRVKEGDLVQPGQVIAVLDSRGQMESVVRELEAQVAVAQTRVAAVGAGGKQSDRAAAEAESARLQAVLANARQDALRYDDLYNKGSATVTEREQRRLLVAVTEQQINAAKARAGGINEVRDTDVRLAEEEVKAAQANVARAEAELQASVIHAPSAGRVLKIVAHPGEEIGPEGLIELGRTDRMYVTAEVDENDVSRVRVGQSATITGDAFKGPLHGKVESIGMRVGKDTMVSTDPLSLTDARVVNVRILLDHSEEASRLIHAQVTAIIEP